VGRAASGAEKIMAREVVLRFRVVSRAPPPYASEPVARERGAIRPSRAGSAMRLTRAERHAAR
jgi:hypothetical protein